MRSSPRRQSCVMRRAPSRRTRPGTAAPSEHVPGLRGTGRSRRAPYLRCPSRPACSGTQPTAQMQQRGRQHRRRAAQPRRPASPRRRTAAPALRLAPRAVPATTHPAAPRSTPRSLPPPRLSPRVHSSSAATPRQPAMLAFEDNRLSPITTRCYAVLCEPPPRFGGNRQRRATNRGEGAHLRSTVGDGAGDPSKRDCRRP